MEEKEIKEAKKQSEKEIRKAQKQAQMQAKKQAKRANEKMIKILLENGVSTEVIEKANQVL